MQPHRYNYPPRRAPIGLLLAVVLLAMLIMATLIAWLAYQFAQLSPPIAMVLRVAIFLMPLAGAVEIGLIAWRRWGTHQYIQAHHVTALTRAERQTLPGGLQSLSFHDSSRPQLAAPVEETHSPPELAPPTIPSFGQLLDQGKVGPGRPLILGYNAETAAAIEGSWSKLYSTGIGGMTGSGKSWLCAFLLGQSVAASSARLIIIDPHSGDPESLSERLSGLAAAYKCGVAQSPTEIEHALKLAAKELADRIAGSPTPHPIILVCDEWTSLLRGRLGELLTKVALDYAEQGRKYGCFAMLAAQGWQVEAAGPVRDRLASHYTMRTRADQMRYQTGLRGQLPFDTMFLKPAEAYFLGVTSALVKVAIPQMSNADLVRIGAMIDRPASVAGRPFGFHAPTTAPLPITPTARAVEGADRRSDEGAPMQAPSTAAGRARSHTPEQARALALFRGGMGIHEVVKEVWQVHGGTKYQQRAGELNSLIRQALTEEG